MSLIEFKKKREYKIGPTIYPITETRTFERDIDESLPLSKRLSKIKEKNGALISLHIGDRYDNYFIAYFNAHSPKLLESTYLGCTILNNLLTKFEDTKVALVPVDLSLLDKDDPLQILKENDVGLYLELATLTSPHMQTKEIGIAIGDGLKKYLVK